MNASIADSQHPSIVYYDSDYPSKDFPVHPENFDKTVWQQGIADDVERYKVLAAQHGKNVLELCCGTGRVSIPLVLDGCKVTGVDISSPMLRRFKNKVAGIDKFPLKNLELIKQNVTKLPVHGQYDVVICAFNSLLCIPDFQLQQQVLFRAAENLKPDGLLALDICNPLVVNLLGDAAPAYFFKRKRTDNGNTYVRYAATGPMTIDQVQEVYGWYDETQPDGRITQTSYSMEWRIIFRYELELMLEKAGFRINSIYGGNCQEPLLPHSLKMFVEAVKL